MSGVAPPLCPACGAAHAAGDRFCADCGAALGPPLGEPLAQPCPGCGGTAFDTDGFCETCGARQPDGPAAWLVVLGPGLAAVTHPGRRHSWNQDAFAITGPPGGGPGVVAVVCDGVSNSQTPDRAAAAATQAAAGVLQAAEGSVTAAVMRAAVVAAHAAVCALPYDRQADVDPPACTLVAVCVQQDGAVVGWLGDSRAYLVSDAGAVLLTHDHSWVNLVVDAGSMPLAEALRDRRAHALVHCLGTTDFTAASPCPEPSLRTVPLPAQGWLLLCTDGLWDYADSPAALLRACPGLGEHGLGEHGPGEHGPGKHGLGETEAGAACQALLAVALDGGGHDNITVAAVRLGARAASA